MHRLSPLASRLALLALPALASTACGARSGLDTGAPEGSGGSGGAPSTSGPCDQTPSNLVRNCSFEQPALAPGTFTMFGPGSAGIPGWTVGDAAGFAGGVDLTTGTYEGAYPVSLGAQSLDLNHNAPGSLSQALATTAGQLYRLTFMLSGFPVTPDCFSTLVKSLLVTAGSATSSVTFTPDQAASPLGVQTFTPQTLSFTASSGSTTLTFTGVNAGCAGPIIDDVTVVPAR